MNPIGIIVGLIQLSIYVALLSKKNTTVEITITILDVPYLVQANVGYVTLIRTRKSAIELIQKIDKTYQKIVKNEQKIENEKIVKIALRIGFTMFFLISGVIVLNCLVNIMKIAIAVLTNSHPSELFLPMSLWFPEYFHKFKLFMTIYDSFVLMLMNFANLVAPELIFITSAYLVAAFDGLSDKVKDVIDGTEGRSFLETKRKLAECVDLHSELIKLADESNRLYGPFNLILLFIVSISICLLGIMSMVIISTMIGYCLFYEYLTVSKIIDNGRLHIL
jgi:hypothetical protein